MTMKISTSLDHAMRIAGVSCRESAAMMKKAGFDGVDLGMCHDQTSPEKIQRPEWMDVLRDQAAALKAEGLEIAQCHMPFYPGSFVQAHPCGDSYQAFEDFMLPGALRALEACGEIGCHLAVMHPFFDESSPRLTCEGNIRLIEKMMPLMEKYDVRLALENVYGINYANVHASRPEDIMAIILRADSPLVGACIDTGHANIFRIDVGNMARTYGRHLFALHVNGNAGGDAHVIPYSMAGWCEHIDFHDFSAALREIGFEGYYNLEIVSGKLPASTAQPFLNYAASVARALADLAR